MGLCLRVKAVPGAQLVLTPPGELSEAFVTLVVVVEDAVQRGSSQVHQRVVGRLLLFAAGVAIEQVIDLVSYFWSGEKKKELNSHNSPQRLY